MKHEDDDHAAPREAWDAIATGYDRFVAPGEAELAQLALDMAHVTEGDLFLDVAAGTGGLSIPAARRGARVLATDWSPAMIECFHARVREEGLGHAEGRVMDCRDLELEDGVFDVTGSQFGVMLVPDQPRALREMVRVTKPGGRVLLIAYGDPAEFEAIHAFVAGLRHVRPDFEGLPDDPPPLEFQVADPAVLERRMTDAGLRDVHVDSTRRERIAVRSGQDLWDWCVHGNPIPGMLVADLTAEQKQAMRGALDRIVAERKESDGVATLSAAVNIAVGTK